MSIYTYKHAFSTFWQFNRYVFLHFEKKTLIHILRGVFIGQRACNTMRSKMTFIARSLTNQNTQFGLKGR